MLIFKDISADRADTYGLVLSASGIAYRSNRGGHGWDMTVAAADYENALVEIVQYIKEERESLSGDCRNFHEYQVTYTGLWAAAILLVCHVAIAAGNDREIFIRTYGASAARILSGEWYRSATALLIHADAGHLAGNISGIVLFGTAVCTLTGWGVGWLMILATGIFGNLANAGLYRQGHLSIGASTSVFGAIGILAALQFLSQASIPYRRGKAWIPVGAAIALLSILGSSKHADVSAHLFGFMAGIGLGALYGLVARRPPAKIYQASLLLVAVGIMIVSWVQGFACG